MGPIAGTIRREWLVDSVGPSVGRLLDGSRLS